VGEKACEVGALLPPGQRLHVTRGETSVGVRAFLSPLRHLS